MRGVIGYSAERKQGFGVTHGGWRATGLAAVDGYACRVRYFQA